MTTHTPLPAAVGGAAAAWPHDNWLRAPRAPSWAPRDLTVALLGLLLIVLWEASGLDLALSRQYGTHAGFLWRDAWPTRALLHDGGRAIAWCVMAFIVGRTLLPDDDGTRAERRYWIGVALVCLLLVPTLKRLAASSCPWDLAEFGGVAAYVPHWRLGVHDGGPGHCFPSGHAVVAFAFFCVYFQWRAQRPWRARAALVAVLGAGVLFGWAQLARGAHFASHTMWSAWLCWTVCALAAWARARNDARRAGRAGAV
jgi:membrane-associated PAP2 superfamily phosphatase